MRLRLPQGEAAAGLRGILDKHGPTLVGLGGAMGDPGFGGLLSTGFARAKALGPRDGSAHGNGGRLATSRPVSPLLGPRRPGLRFPGLPLDAESPRKRLGFGGFGIRLAAGGRAADGGGVRGEG